jgi:serine protease Do
LTLVAVGGIGAATWGVGTSLVKDVQFARAEAQVADARSTLATAGDMSNVYKAVNHAMENSVVHLTVSKSVRATPGQMSPQDLFRFFGPNGQGQPRRGQPQEPDADGNNEEAQPPSPEEQQQLERATGSGVIMDAKDGDAWIVTNNHVVADASEVDVVLNDGRRIENATVVATDPKTDLAVVKIKADRVMAAKWGDSETLEKGDIVVAFGSPFGFVGSMSHGIVSALNRDRVDIISRQNTGGFAYENFIQVDAAINPGNSGGPLCNTRGEVIGINTAIASRSGSFSGIGFAIPSSQAKTVFESLKTNGKVVRGYLGIGIDDIHSDNPNTKAGVEAAGFKGENGIFVSSVLSNSPALNVLKLSDIITELNGQPLKSMTEFRTKVAAMPPGQVAKLKVWRVTSRSDNDGDGNGIINVRMFIDVEVKLGTQPEGDLAMAGGQPGGRQTPAPAQQMNALGLSVSTPTAEELEAAGLPGESRGAIVKQVRPGSPASMLGIRPGDLVTRIGQTPVTSAEDARAALAKADLTKGLRIDTLNKQGERMMMLPKRGR